MDQNYIIAFEKSNLVLNKNYYHLKCWCYNDAFCENLVLLFSTQSSSYYRISFGFFLHLTAAHYERTVAKIVFHSVIANCAEKYFQKAAHLK